MASVYRAARSAVLHVGLTTSAEAFDVAGWLGTAFVVDDSCLVATAKHVIEGQNPTLLFVHYSVPPVHRSWRSRRVEVVYMDDAKDLAFLRVIIPGKTCQSRSLAPLGLPSEVNIRALGGKGVLLFGFPMLIKGELDLSVPVGRGGIVASGEITWEQQPMLLLDLPGIKGFSGSPILLVETGEVIGVHRGPWPTERRKDFAWSTPISTKDYELALGSEAMAKSKPAAAGAGEGYRPSGALDAVD